MEEEQKQIISDYITAYNNFDIAGMAKHLDEHVVFENISKGEVTLRTTGLAAFVNQAETAKGYFKEREQTITSWFFSGHQVKVDISYRGVLQVDIPNGPKSGETLNLTGRSEFELLNGRIISLKDFS
jgi:hypothetical protein